MGFTINRAEPGRRATATDDGGDILYRCTHCGHWLTADRFYRLVNAASRCGLNSWCKACHCTLRTQNKRARRERKLAAIAAATAGVVATAAGGKEAA